MVMVSPLEAVSVELAVSVVKAPEFAVPEPIPVGDAKVAPPREDAFIVPEPVKSKDAPEPTTMEAVVFVPDDNPENVAPPEVLLMVTVEPEEVTVVDPVPVKVSVPPKDTDPVPEFPAKLILLFERDELVIFDSVFVAPEIDLFVKISLLEAEIKL